MLTLFYVLNTSEINNWMRHLFLFIVILVTSISVIGQKITSSSSIKDFHVHRHELGINVTNVLGNVFSLNPESDPYPYLLTYRKHLNPNIAIRTGFNLGINQSVDSGFDGNSFIERKLSTYRTDLRLGLERKIPLSQKFLFSYGIDVLGRFNIENSEVKNRGFMGTTFISQERTIGGGFGPMMRFEFKISNRMFLSIESSFYGFYSQKTETIEINGLRDTEPAKSFFNLEMALPQSLFFNVAF